MTWLVDADVKEPVIVTGVSATGGTESTIRVGAQLYRLHTFTESGTFEVNTAGKVECFLVGGGGAGGQTVGTYGADIGLWDGQEAVVIATGGGGGGGVVRADLDLESTGSYAVTVGAGGEIDTTLAPDDPVPDSADLDGGDSKIAFGGSDLLIAKGGGGGGGNTWPAGSLAYDGRAGGSGGGGACRIQLVAGSSSASPTSAKSGGASIFGQGTNGADGTFIEATSFGNGADGCATIGGGGGGAFSAGQSIELVLESDVLIPKPSGGNGVQSNFSGVLQTYAGGGGSLFNGADGNPLGFLNYKGKGGAGGGGDSARGYPSTQASQAGTDGLGGGGGGGYTIEVYVNSFVDQVVESVQASNGGSGIVMIRYPIEG